MNSININEEQSLIHKPKRWKKILASIFITLFVLIIVVLSVIPHLIMKDMVNMHVDFKEMYSAEDFGITSQKLKLKTEDGLNITAYEVDAADPKAIVIFISGIHNPSVTAFFGHAGMLKKNGYGSILLEMRAHGESEGNLVCVGYKEYLDTKAVVDYITNRYKDVPIVVCGVSMGGATAINSMGEIKEIDGLISLSAYSSFEDNFYDIMLKMGAPKAYAVIQRPFIKLYTMLRYGLKSANITPKNEIKKIGNRPALIIHSTQDSQVPYSNFERIMKEAPKHVETWVKEGDHHFILDNDDYFLSPEKDKEYSQHILKFLNDNFRN